MLAALAQVATVSAATPAASRPAGLRRHRDAACEQRTARRGLAQLRRRDRVLVDLALEARGSSTPVLELAVTSIRYGAVPASEFELDTRPVRPSFRSACRRAHAGHAGRRRGPVSKALSFSLTAPASLEGSRWARCACSARAPRRRRCSAIGSGLGTVLVLERSTAAASGAFGSPLDLLPGVSIAGSQGHELSTPLGTIVSVDHGGISFTVAGSIGSSEAEAIARSLAS